MFDFYSFSDISSKLPRILLSTDAKIQIGVIFGMIPSSVHAFR